MQREEANENAKTLNQKNHLITWCYPTLTKMNQAKYCLIHLLIKLSKNYKFLIFIL